MKGSTRMAGMTGNTTMVMMGGTMRASTMMTARLTMATATALMIDTEERPQLAADCLREEQQQVPVLPGLRGGERRPLPLLDGTTTIITTIIMTMATSVWALQRMTYGTVVPASAPRKRVPLVLLGRVASLYLSCTSVRAAAWWWLCLQTRSLLALALVAAALLPLLVQLEGEGKALRGLEVELVPVVEAEQVAAPPLGLADGPQLCGALARTATVSLARTCPCMTLGMGRRAMAGEGVEAAAAPARRALARMQAPHRRPSWFARPPLVAARKGG